MLFLFLLKQAFGQKIKESLLYYNDTLIDYSNKSLYNGEYISYYPGDRKFSGYFLNGLKHGKFVYYKNPKECCGFFGIDSIVNYNKGNLNGEKLVYTHSNCSSLEFIKQKHIYSNGKLNGTSYYWDNSFQLERITKYKNDEVIEDKIYETDSSINYLRVIIKEFPNDTVILDKLADSLTLEVVGVPYYQDENSSIFRFKKMEKFKIKSFMAIKGMKFQIFNSNKIASQVFKTNGLCSSRNVVEIKDILVIDKNNIEYILPIEYFITK